MRHADHVEPSSPLCHRTFVFKPTTLQRAIRKLGFVQADPIRAPARAQDLTLRHRVTGYRAGDLERRYPRLSLEEDFFINYGFLPRAHHGLMHPRTPASAWIPVRQRQAEEILAFIENAEPRIRGLWTPILRTAKSPTFGGSSNATTQLLDEMHYRGLLRIARRDGGTRVYAAREFVEGPLDDAGVSARIDALVDVIVQKYAPLPANSLGQLLTRLRDGAPQWAEHRAKALERAKQRLAHAKVEGVDWIGPSKKGRSRPAGSPMRV